MRESLIYKKIMTIIFKHARTASSDEQCGMNLRRGLALDLGKWFAEIVSFEPAVFFKTFFPGKVLEGGMYLLNDFSQTLIKYPLWFDIFIAAASAAILLLPLAGYTYRHAYQSACTYSMHVYNI